VPSEPSVRILIAEDNPGDVLLMREVLRESRIPSEVNVTGDGVETMQYLRRAGAYAHTPRPSLVLLDLNMPRKDGREVLVEMKSDPSLRSIPVVVMTSSSAEEDVNRAYESHANCYVRKPSSFEQLREVVREIQNFWFGVASLPT
jgi:two-component system, chemotaxis family, response regulator Rcp1